MLAVKLEKVYRKLVKNYFTYVTMTAPKEESKPPATKAPTRKSERKEEEEWASLDLVEKLRLLSPDQLGVIMEMVM